MTSILQDHIRLVLLENRGRVLRFDMDPIGVGLLWVGVDGLVDRFLTHDLELILVILEVLQHLRIWQVRIGQVRDCCLCLPICH